MPEFILEINHIAVILMENRCSGKPFTSKDDLIECMLIHTGDGPHSCKICGKSYSLKGYLRRHMHIRHNCDTCRKSLTQSLYLTTQILINKGGKSLDVEWVGIRLHR